VYFPMAEALYKFSPPNPIMASKKRKPAKTSENTSQVVEVSLPEGVSEFVIPAAIVLSAILISISIVYAGSKLQGSGTTLGATEERAEAADGNTEGTQEAPQEEDAPPGDFVRNYETFTEYDLDICKEDGKPVIYLFSTTWCQHCTWIADTFDKWAEDNSDKVIAYHWEIDMSDNTLTDKTETKVPDEHMEVYNKFNPRGSIPTFVFGCRYSRIGNGHESDQDLGKEIASFDKILKELL